MDFAVSAYRSAGVARDLMHRYKYRKQLHLSRLMGSLMTAVWNDQRLHRRDWIVVPVPLHPKRMRTRGFNQSHEIAQELIRRGGGGLKMQLQPILKRARHTIRQARLDRKERLENLQGAFELKPGTDLDEESVNVLLVDDVITTGTTVSECALVLRESLDIDVIAAVSVMRG
jgi:ComF family protein